MFKLRSAGTIAYRIPFGSMYSTSQNISVPRVKNISLKNTHLVAETLALVKLNNPDKALFNLQTLVSKKAKIQATLCQSLIDCFAQDRGMDKSTPWIGTILSAYTKTNFIHQRSSLPHHILDLTRKHEMKLENMIKIHEFITPLKVAPSPEAASALLQKYEQTRHDPDLWAKTSSKLNQQSYFILYRSLFVTTFRTQQFSEWSFKLLNDMKSLGLEPSLQQYTRVLGRLKRFKNNEAELAWREAHGFLLNQTPDNSSDRIAGLALESAYEGRFDEATDLLQEAIQKGDKFPGLSAITSIMEFSRHKGRHDIVKKVYDVVCNSISELPMGHRRSALIKVSNSAIISFAQQKKHHEALKCYEHMRKIETMPSSDAYACLLMNVRDEDLDRLYSEARGYYSKLTPYFFNIVISRFSKKKEYKKAILVFEDMLSGNVKPNSVTFGSLISACVRCRSESSAIYYFEKMVESDMVSASAIHVMMKLYQRQKDVSKVMNYFDLCKKHDLAPTEPMYKTLLEIYAVKDIHKAHQILLDMVKNNVSPTASHYAVMIHTYGVRRRDLNSALMMYDEMLAAKIKPDDNLFQAMASAFSKNNQPDKAQEYRFKIVGER